jgi:Zn-dependent protease
MSDAASAISDAAPRRQLQGPFGGRAVRLGRVGRIDIGIDLSWFLIFALVVLALRTRFGAEEPPWTAFEAWAAGFLGAMVFFLSVILHELGHGLTSNALGLPVRSITLFVFGGLARLSGKPKRPRDEFLIGVAGPAVSLALAGLFAGCAWLLPEEPRASAVAGTVLTWLGTINLLLVAFNLVPGHPLDGGHLLRAGVWAATGDERLADRVTNLLGRAFAFFLVAVGATTLLLFGAMGGLWLVLIGWFLARAARGSEMHAQLESRLSGLRAADVLGGGYPTVSAGTTVAELLSGAILRRGERYFAVLESDRFVGIVTLADVRRVPDAERAHTTVATVMTPPARLVTLEHDESLWTGMQRMDDAGVGQLPVLREGALVGVLSRERLLRVLRNQLDLGRPPH